MLEPLMSVCGEGFLLVMQHLGVFPLAGQLFFLFQIHFVSECV